MAAKSMRAHKILFSPMMITNKLRLRPIRTHHQREQRRNEHLSKSKLFMQPICLTCIHQRNTMNYHVARHNIYIVFSARKYGKWWLQCFLTGIERVLLGFRDDYGIVRRIQPLLIKDIESRAVRFMLYMIDLLSIAHVLCLVSSVLQFNSALGVQVRFWHFFMNSVRLFVKQLPKIISMMIGLGLMERKYS
jgi:hypothetical protein